MIDLTRLEELSNVNSLDDIRALKEETENVIHLLIDNLSKVSAISVENIFIDIHESKYHNRTGELKTILKVQIDMRL